ncbi:hypothetical protein MKY95_23300 [Paenibacillus sp. FSL P4-0176]|uniref:hypothetical protein n=1 Tax=Paenibacillus sp. FSL P4-0176 TaxID=2921631 RepID=UPI0030D1AF2E
MSKQEEIKQALAALKPSTELYMVWCQRDGLMCITEYDKAAQEYEEQLDAMKDLVASYGSEENERVVFARIEKQAYVTIYETSDHSDLMAAWDDYEREDTENAELLRLRKELEEAHYALNAISMGEWACTFDEQGLEVWTTRRINPGRIAREALALVGQEGEGNQE